MESLFNTSLALFLLLVANAGNTRAEPHEHREHGAHEHGVAMLTVALTDHALNVEFDSPAVNLVGFEHAPHSDSDRQAIKQAADRLNHPLNLLSLPIAAHCVTHKIAVESALLNSAEKADHAKNVTMPTQHAAHHDHDGHADFNAKYELQCQSPEALDVVGVQLFETFKGIEKINAQWLTATAQSAKVLTPSDHTIRLQ